MRDNVATLFYSATLGVVCALLLTGVGLLTEPKRRANARAEEVRNILSVLGAPVPADATPSQLLDTFRQNVREEGDGLTYYVYEDPASSGRPRAIAVHFSGQGLWGPIRGLLALEPDMRTVRGISFYDQEETPGLGGEISSDWFQQQFVGKKIVGPDGEPGIRIRPPGEAAAQNEVDAITGATMTSERVEQMLDDTIRAIMKGRADGN
jgi:Na+-transporting NADH:ubiquinone oxidoreductase subunit C